MKPLLSVVRIAFSYAIREYGPEENGFANLSWISLVVRKWFRASEVVLNLAEQTS
jgi:hypothetical protein